MLPARPATAGIDPPHRSTPDPTTRGPCPAEDPRRRRRKPGVPPDRRRALPRPREDLRIGGWPRRLAAEGSRTRPRGKREQARQSRRRSVARGRKISPIYDLSKRSAKWRPWGQSWGGDLGVSRVFLYWVIAGRGDLGVSRVFLYSVIAGRRVAAAKSPGRTRSRGWTPCKSTLKYRNTRLTLSSLEIQEYTIDPLYSLASSLASLSSLSLASLASSSSPRSTASFRRSPGRRCRFAWKSNRSSV
jgi:hypothetical protein